MRAPIPPLPGPCIPYALSPEVQEVRRLWQLNRFEELTQYINAAALQRYFFVFNNILTYYSEETQRIIGQLPPKRKAPSYPGEDRQQSLPKKARIVAGQRVRSPQQKSKHRIRNAQRMSKYRKDASATLESQRARSAEEVATVTMERYSILQLQLIVSG